MSTHRWTDALTCRGLVATDSGAKPSDDGPPTLSRAGMDRAIGREILRLAEEVERLKAEPARIKREMLAELAANKVEGVPGVWYLRERDFLAIVDRIVPGEG